MYKSAEVIQGKTVVARIKPGMELFKALKEVLKEHQIDNGYIPVLQGSLKSMKLLSVIHNEEDADDPRDKVIEVNESLIFSGAGTIAKDKDGPFFHLHIAAVKEEEITFVGHLLSAEVVLTTEVVIVETKGTEMVRAEDPQVYNYKLLDFKS